MIDIVRTMLANSTLCPSAHLSETLAALRRILRWTKLAVKVYRHTPLEKSFNSAIAVEVEQCRQHLQELLNNLSNYHHILSEAVLYFIRRYVCRRLGEGGRVDVLNSKLRHCHKTFAAYLLTLGR